MQVRNEKRKNGFTIIEIMIVLAIAGLIMLIVFLAVPALQRAARNTQRKNDVAAVAAAISDYSDNNGGDLPNTVSGNSNGDLVLSNGCKQGAPGCNVETAKLGYYSPGEFYTTAPATPTADGSSVYLYFNDSCNSSNTALAGPVGTTPRSTAIIYWVETGSSPALSEQCLDS